jgi:hypothetical protein
MVEKSEEKYGKMIKDAVADIGAQAAQMFLLQDMNFHTWTVDIVKQLDKRFNNVDFKVETDIVISKLVLQKADAITVSQDFIRSDQNETMNQLDEQLKYMQMFNPQAGAGDLIRTANGLEEFTDNIDSGPKHDDQHSKKQGKNNQNTTLQTNANPGLANTPAKNKKNASNEEQIPGTEKHAAAKNKEFHEKKTSNEASPPKRSMKISFIPDPDDPGETVVRNEYQEYKSENDWQFQQTKSMKRKLRARRKTDKTRAQAEVLLHGIETTKYIDGKLFHINEAIKAVEFLEEISRDNLGDDGLDIELGHIVKACRLDLWTGPGKFKPMVVQFVDIATADAVMKAMKISGYFK